MSTWQISLDIGKVRICKQPILWGGRTVLLVMEGALVDGQKYRDVEAMARYMAICDTKILSLCVRIKIVLSFLIIVHGNNILHNIAD